MNQSSVENKKIVSFDIAKWIMSYAIVAIHCCGKYTWHPWLRLAVPLYFVISSYLFFVKFDCISEKRKNSVLKQYILRLMILYICWTLIQLVYILPKYNNFNFSLSFNIGIRILIKHLLWGNTFTASWYLIASAIGMLLVIYIKKFLPINVVLLFGAGIYIFCCLASNYFYIIPKNSILYKIICSHPLIYYNYFPVSVLWISIGLYFANEKDIKIIDNKILIIFLVIFLSLLYCEYILIRKFNLCFECDCYFLLIPNVLIIFLLLLRINHLLLLFVPENFSFYLRKISTVVFCSHGLFLYFYSKVIDKSFLGLEKRYFLYFLVLLSSSFLGYILTKLSKSTKFKLIKYIL